MTPKRLFNPEGTREVGAQRLVGGPTTNLLEFAQCRYPWAETLYKRMRQFFWLPEEIALADDKRQFPVLSRPEQAAFQKVLAFLIFLDSIQIDNVSYLAEYITAPEVVACLKTQAFFETIHAQSYDYLLTSVVDVLTREAVYEMWREDPILLARNRFVTDQYEAFRENATESGFIRVLVANFLLEGVYFYSGFAFFYALARSGVMGGSASLIRLIQRDENTHLALFTQMIRTLQAEEPSWFTETVRVELTAMVKTAVEQEIAWGQHIVGRHLAGIDGETLAAYVQYLGNQRARAIGLMAPYPAIRTHPMPWVDTLAAMNSTKTDFFERRVTNYQKGAGVLRVESLKPPPIIPLSDR